MTHIESNVPEILCQKFKFGNGTSNTKPLECIYKNSYAAAQLKKSRNRLSASQCIFIIFEDTLYGLRIYPV